MSLFDAWRLKFGKRALRRESPPKRERKGASLEEARSIGVLYLDGDENHFRHIRTYVRGLVGEHGIRHFRMLGYVPMPEKQTPVWQANKLELHFFTKSHCSALFKPKSEEVRQFEKEPFDILIDLSPGNSLPLRWVLKRSNAKMKVGRVGCPSAEDCDLVLDLNQADSLDDYMKQVSHYLAKFNYA